MNVNTVNSNYVSPQQYSKNKVSFGSAIPVKFTLHYYPITKRKDVRQNVSVFVEILKGTKHNKGILDYFTSFIHDLTPYLSTEKLVRHSNYEGVDYIFTGEDAERLEDLGHRIGKASKEMKSSAKKAYYRALGEIVKGKTRTLELEVVEAPGPKKSKIYDIIGANFEPAPQIHSTGGDNFQSKVSNGGNWWSGLD